MKISLKKVKVHNLKNVDLDLDPNQLIVFTGVSGSGKSSLAFNTIYTEGQRRYVESLSTFARRHMGDLPKPDAELIEGISPTIAIEQKAGGKNPRSTVGTMTGIYDYMRVLYARTGLPHCPESGECVRPQSIPQILEKIQNKPNSGKLIILSPFMKGKKGEFKEDLADLLRRGFMRIRLDGQIMDLSDDIEIDKLSAHDIDIVIDRILSTDLARLKEAVTQGLDIGKGVMSTLDPVSNEETLYSIHAFAVKSGKSYPPLEPHDFSFNHPTGMCNTCQGLGTVQDFKLDLIIDPELSISEDCCVLAPSYKTVRFGNIYNNLAHLYDFDVSTPWKKLSERAKKAFLMGNNAKWTKMTFVHPEKKTTWTDYVKWRGVLGEIRQRYTEASSETYRTKMQQYMEETVCTECAGSRIKAYPAATLFEGKTIYEITRLSVKDALEFFQKAPLTQVSQELLREIIRRFEFLMGVGLHYLTLGRTSPTLSGGEAQRVRLASQIGSGLVGTTYILDEPSIGLHPRDNAKLLDTLKALRDKGNTVIVVEHDEETILHADHIVDVGPLAGSKGGEIIVDGSVADLLASQRSVTGAYLSGRLLLPIPEKRRKVGKNVIKVVDASHHNLKNITVSFPLGVLTAVTGVSGSGKSSLISDILSPALSNKLQKSSLKVGSHKKIEGIEHLDKTIEIDQSPIGRTPRSNPATYVKVFDEIRELFSKLPESVASGLSAGHFSFNVKTGSCPHCSGMGMIKIDMDFMEEEWTPCVHCKGKRFDDKTLSILFRGKSIYDILEMTVAEALEFFDPIPSIKQKVETLKKVGLDYIKLGQPSPTLSGGEAQRIKLAKELSRPSTGQTFYILDEPTTGLHFHDIHKLIDVLQSLVDRGNSVLVIEHNMDLVKVADWIIELGPEGGDAGGELLATGTPEKIIKLQTPTAQALRDFAELRTKKIEKKSAVQKASTTIQVTGASQNNLKSLNACIPRNKISVCTGPSGSGKTSFAFDTIYAEGQRRYTDSLSPYVRQFIKQMPKPVVENVEGLSPAIAIEQKNHSGNPRSTVGTMTEAYDFLRVLYAYMGTAYSPETGKEIKAISKNYVVEKLIELPPGERLYILSPVTLKKTEDFQAWKEKMQQRGFLRIRLNGKYFELDETIEFNKSTKNACFLVIDRLITGQDIKKRLFEAVSQASDFSEGMLIADVQGRDLFFNLAFADPSTGKSYPAISPHTFSFNTEHGMCLDCTGLGFQYGIDLSQNKEVLKYSPISLIQMLWKTGTSKQALELYKAVLKENKISPYTPLSEAPLEHLAILFKGKSSVKIDDCTFEWIGINALFEKIVKASLEFRDALLPLLSSSTCSSCQGTRLNPLARHVRIGNLGIADFCKLPVEDAYAFTSSLKSSKLLEETLRQLLSRLHFLKAIGLGYLSLDRSAPTLSGGETQRIRLSRQLGSGLTGCLYVLDEPTIGLHPHDNTLLNDALIQLKNMGNTLLLVEHDPLTMAIADYFLDFGPGAGNEGGLIVAQGTQDELKENPLSLTGAYLSGRKKIPIPEKRRAAAKYLTLPESSINNLKDVKLGIPLKVLSCLTGVSGSGKSTLLNKVLLPFVQNALQKRQKDFFFDKLIVIDQNPIGHTIRADIHTYTDISAPIRALFAALPSAQIKGLQPKHFSSNHMKGMCRSCWGLGVRSIPLQFLSPVKVQCEACQGLRLNPLALSVTFKGKNLGEVLQMNVIEARDFLSAQPKLVKILDTLISVGLGYLKLCQEVATLSGGEQQRMRLSRELSKRSTGKTLYLFDEPTTGLHSEDILKLLSIFHTLVDKGNTVVLIEHNLDVIANADYIIDVGPGPGAKGGRILFEGTPEDLLQNKKSLTAQYLKTILIKKTKKSKS